MDTPNPLSILPVAWNVGELLERLSVSFDLPLSAAWSKVTAVTRDRQGSYYVAGNTGSTFGNAFVAKISADGVPVWGAGVGSPYWDNASDVIVDQGGNVYLVGVSNGNIGGNYNQENLAHPDFSTSKPYPSPRQVSYDLFVASFDSQGQKSGVSMFGSVGDDSFGWSAAASGSDGIVIHYFEVSIPFLATVSRSADTRKTPAPESEVYVRLNNGLIAEDGAANLVYTFSRTGSTANSLTVNFAVGGTALLTAASTDPADYVFLGQTSSSSSHSVIFAAGSSTAVVVLDPVADRQAEGDETVALTLTAGTGYTVGTATAVVGIIANDEPESTVPPPSNDNPVTPPSNDNTVTPPPTDSTAPTVTDLRVDGATLILTLNEALKATGPSIGRFSVQVGGVTRAVNSASVEASGKTVTLQLAAAVSSGQAVTLAYSTSIPANESGGVIEDAAGNDLAGFAATAVSNVTPAPHMWRQEWLRETSSSLTTSVPESIGWLAADREGAAYVVGYASNPEASGTDIFVQKYLDDGDLVWKARIDVGQTDYQPSLAMTSQGGLVVTGVAFDAKHKGFVALLDAKGEKAWTADTAGNVPYSVQSSPDGSVYVGGADYVRFQNDAFLSKHNADGSVAWTRRIAGDKDQVARSVAVSGDGQSVYLGGGEWRGASSDGFIRKYLPDGSLVWTEYYSSSLGDAVSLVKVAQDGSIYVIGETSGVLPEGMASSAEPRNGFISLVGSDGRKVWTRMLPGLTPTDLSIDVLGNATVIATEKMKDSLPFLLTYTTAGELRSMEAIGANVVRSASLSLASGLGGATYIAGANQYANQNVGEGGTSFVSRLTRLLALDASPAPTDLRLSRSSFDENIAGGSAVAVLSATDPDHGETLTYSLVDGVGSSDNAAFLVDGNQLKLKVSPDFETKNSYGIRLQAKDASGLTLERAVVLSVLNQGSGTIQGTNGDDRIVGEEGNDDLQGNGGDDVFVGGKGDDLINGGPGTDTATYLGRRESYVVASASASAVTIRDTLEFRDGVDTVTGVEVFRFADATWTLDELTNAAPLHTQSPLDFTADGSVDPMDSLLIMRLMMGTFPGDALTQGVARLPSAATPDGLRQKMMALLAEPSALRAGGRRMDVDGDGSIHPFGDGLMILQYLHGREPQQLSGGVLPLPDFIHNSLRDFSDMQAHLKALTGF